MAKTGRDFDGKAALITGGDGGMGVGIAARLASKGAAVTIVGAQGVLANVVMPTMTMTAMGRAAWGDHPAKAEWLASKIPSGRFAEVGDIVDLVEFLVGPKNNYISGALVPIDGGLLTGLTDGPPDEPE